MNLMSHLLNAGRRSPPRLPPQNDDEELTASFDPFDATENDEAKQVKVRWWSSHVNHELSSHRSPLVAAEILLRQLREYGGGHSEIAEDLLLVTALPVLHQCAPGLGTYGDLLQSALHEVVPTIMFTRTLALNHGEVLQRVSYAECFSRIKSKFEHHVKLSSSLQHRAALEDEVMVRVVRRLDNLWVKMCFMAWKGLCNQMNAKKKGFQRLATRGAALRVVPGLVRLWRRYAHGITLREKLSKHSALSKNLEGLYLVEQGAKSRHERTLEEVREKTRLLEAVTERCIATESRLTVLQSILDETDLSLRAHWSCWNEAMTNIFCDKHAFQPHAIGNIRNDVQSATQNITDTATLYLKEARKRTWKIGKSTICQYISKAKLRDVDIEEILSPDDLVNVVTSICHPVVSPLRLIDIAHDDQQKFDLTLKFLSSINDGGHCSLFTDQNIECVDECVTDFRKECGKKMVSHVAAGIDSLHLCPESNEKYLHAVRECLEKEELIQIHDYLSRVFYELSAAGVPLNREKVEVCICSVVEPHESQVVRAFYPSHGIHSISDMINYLSKVSQFSSWTITALVEHIEANYNTGPYEEISMMLHDEDTLRYLGEHSAELSCIFAKLRDRRFPMILSEEVTRRFLCQKFDLSSNEVDILFQLGADSKNVCKDDFGKFLLGLATFANPSPFISAADKIADVIDRCTEP